MDNVASDDELTGGGRKKMVGKSEARPVYACRGNKHNAKRGLGARHASSTFETAKPSGLSMASDIRVKLRVDVENGATDLPD